MPPYGVAAFKNLVGGAYYYDDEVRAGRTMVIVHAEPAAVEEARRILLREGAFDASPIEAPIHKAS